MTPSRTDISKKYALAFIHVFKQDLDGSILDKLKAAYEFLSKNTNMLFLLSSYDTTPEEKQKIATTFVDFFSFPQSMHKLIDLLLQKKHICLLADILRDAYCCYKKENNIEDLEIRSSSILSEDDQKILGQFFINLSDKKYRINIEQDADLIAGIRMQSDTLLWEHSVAKKMKKLRFDLLKKV
jgi:F-type H+-transporting ATPase subunit delta